MCLIITFTAGAGGCGGTGERRVTLLAKLAARLTAHFIRTGAVQAAEREVYEYHFEVMLAEALNFAALLVGGLLSGELLCTLLFTASFLVFRSVGGGFHASTHLRCFLTLAAVYGALLLLLHFGTGTLLRFGVVVMLLAGTILLFFLAPAEHENNPMEEAQRARLSARARLLSLLFALVGVTLLSAMPQAAPWLFACVYGMFSVAGSVLAARILQARRAQSAARTEAEREKYGAPLDRNGKRIG